MKKLLLILLCFSVFFIGCVNPPPNKSEDSTNNETIYEDISSNDADITNKEFYDDEEATKENVGDDNGWIQSDILFLMKECQEGWGANTQESKDYCECIVSKCMSEWGSKKEMDRYFEYGMGSDIDMEEWAESCMLEISVD